MGAAELLDDVLRYLVEKEAKEFTRVFGHNATPEAKASMQLAFCSSMERVVVLFRQEVERRLADEGEDN